MAGFIGPDLALGRAYRDTVGLLDLEPEVDQLGYVLAPQPIYSYRDRRFYPAVFEESRRIPSLRSVPAFMDRGEYLVVRNRLVHASPWEEVLSNADEQWRLRHPRLSHDFFGPHLHPRHPAADPRPRVPGVQVRAATFRVPRQALREFPHDGLDLPVAAEEARFRDQVMEHLNPRGGEANDATIVDPVMQHVGAEELLHLRNWLLMLTDDPKNAPFFHGDGADRTRWQVRLQLYHHRRRPDDEIEHDDDLNPLHVLDPAEYNAPFEVLSRVRVHPADAITDALGRVLDQVRKYEIDDVVFGHINFVEFKLPHGGRGGVRVRRFHDALWRTLAVDYGKLLMMPSYATHSNCLFTSAILHYWSMQDTGCLYLLMQLGVLSEEETVAGAEREAAEAVQDALNYDDAHNVVFVAETDDEAGTIAEQRAAVGADAIETHAMEPEAGVTLEELQTRVANTRTPSEVNAAAYQRANPHCRRLTEAASSLKTRLIAFVEKTVREEYPEALGADGDEAEDELRLFLCSLCPATYSTEQTCAWLARYWRCPVRILDEAFDVVREYRPTEADLARRRASTSFGPRDLPEAKRRALWDRGMDVVCYANHFHPTIQMGFRTPETRRRVHELLHAIPNAEVPAAVQRVAATALRKKEIDALASRHVPAPRVVPLRTDLSAGQRRRARAADMDPFIPRRPRGRPRLVRQISNDDQADESFRIWDETALVNEAQGLPAAAPAPPRPALPAPDAPLAAEATTIVRVPAFNRHKFGTFDFEACPVQIGADGTPVFRPYMAATAFVTLNTPPPAGDPEVFLHRGEECANLLLLTWAQYAAQGTLPGVMVAHNGSRFDSILLLRELLQAEHWCYWRVVARDSLCSNGRWLRLTIEFVGLTPTEYLPDSVYRDQRRMRPRTTLLCSYALLPSSLAALTKDFRVTHPKLDTVNHDDITIANWEEKAVEYDLEQYLRHDVLGLFEVYEAYGKQIYETYGADITAMLTQAQLAKHVYAHVFYPRIVACAPLYTTPPALLPFLQEAVHGGYVHVGLMGAVGIEAKETAPPELVVSPCPPLIFWYDGCSAYPTGCLSSLPVGRPRPIYGAEAGAALFQPRADSLGVHRIRDDVFGVVRVYVWYPNAVSLHTAKENATHWPVHGLVYRNRFVYPYMTRDARQVLTLTTETIRHWQQVCPGLVAYEPAPNPDWNGLVAVLYERGLPMAEYMLHFAKEKAAARLAGEVAREGAAKLFMNSLVGIKMINRVGKDVVRMITLSPEMPDVGLADLYELFDTETLVDFATYIDATGQRVIFVRCIEDLPPSEQDAKAQSLFVMSYARDALLYRMHLVRQRGGKVFYGDTDSMAISIDPKSDESLHPLFFQARPETVPPTMDFEGSQLGTWGDEILKSWRKKHKARATPEALAAQLARQDAYMRADAVGRNANFFRKTRSLAATQLTVVGSKLYGWQIGSAYSALPPAPTTLPEEDVLRVTHAKGQSGTIPFCDLIHVAQEFYLNEAGDDLDAEAVARAIKRPQRQFRSGAAAMLAGPGAMPAVKLVRTEKRLRATAGTKFNINPLTGYTYPLLITEPLAPAVDLRTGRTLDMMDDFEEYGVDRVHDMRAPNPGYEFDPDFTTAPRLSATLLAQRQRQAAAAAAEA